MKSMVGKKTKHIWEAYQEVLAELKKKETAASTVDVAKAKNLEAALRVAENGNIDEMASTLDGISRGLLDARKVYFDLKEAIAAKKEELRQVHQLEVEVNSLVAAVKAKDELIKERTVVADQIIQQATERAAEIKADAKELTEAMKRDSEERLAADEKSRKRIAAEWDYDFKRRQRTELDKVQDEIDKRMKAAAQREEAVTLREAKADEMEEKVGALESLLEAEKNARQDLINTAVAEAKAKAAKSAAIEKSIATKEYEGKIAVLQAQNDSLIDQVEGLTRRLDRAEAQVQAANDKVTSIATGALRAGADAATVAKVSEIAAGSQSKK